MDQTTPLHKALKKIVRFPTIEEALCDGKVVVYQELLKSIGNRLSIPERPECKGYVRSLANNIVKHGRVHVPILISKASSNLYTVEDGVYRIKAIELIQKEFPTLEITIKVKLKIEENEK